MRAGSDPPRLGAMVRQLLAIASALLLGACATGSDAPVRDLSSGTPPPRAGVAAATSFDSHVVVAGDTLYGIAFRHGLDYRALAVWNRIDPPFTIRPGLRLRLTPPEPARIQSEASPRPVAAEAAPVPRPADPAPAWMQEPPPEGSAQTFGIESGVVSAPALRVEPADAGAAAVSPLPPSELRAGSAASASTQSPAPAVAAPRTTSPATGPLSAAIASPRPPSSPPPAASAPAAGKPATRPAPSAGAPAAAATPAPAADAIPAGPSQKVGGVTWRWPADGQVVVRFAPGDPARQGIDIRGRDGAPVRAAADGEVVYSGSGLVGYGELIIIKHSAEYLSAYGYNRRRLVEEGQRVRAGQQIAEMGKANANLDVLHFEIRRSGKPVDPLQVLPRR